MSMRLILSLDYCNNLSWVGRGRAKRLLAFDLLRRLLRHLCGSRPPCFRSRVHLGPVVVTVPLGLSIGLHEEAEALDPVIYS